MAKQHSLTKGGLVAAVIAGGVLLNHTDELAQNASNAGNFGKELICVAQDLTGGMVQMPLCVDSPAPASNAPASSQGD
jgi:hypothetical protein